MYICGLYSNLSSDSKSGIFLKALSRTSDVDKLMSSSIVASGDATVKTYVDCRVEHLRLDGEKELFSCELRHLIPLLLPAHRSFFELKIHFHHESMVESHLAKKGSNSQCL